MPEPRPTDEQRASWFQEAVEGEATHSSEAMADLLDAIFAAGAATQAELDAAQAKVDRVEEVLADWSTNWPLWYAVRDALDGTGSGQERDADA